MIGGSDIARLDAYERQARQQAEANVWPEGVIARYLTVGGALIDILDNEDAARWRYDTKCTGCPYKNAFTSEDAAHRDAQAHAEKCRALPRPAVTS